MFSSYIEADSARRSLTVGQSRIWLHGGLSIIGVGGGLVTDANVKPDELYLYYK